MKTAQKHTLADVLSYGLLVRRDEDTGICVVANGAYYNFFQDNEDGTFSRIEHIVYTRLDNGLYAITAAKPLDNAEVLVSELLTEQNNEE